MSTPGDLVFLATIDPSGFLTGVQQMQTGVNNIQMSTDSAANSQVGFAQSAEGATASITNFGVQTQTTTSSLQQFVISSNNANQSMTSFGLQMTRMVAVSATLFTLLDREEIQSERLANAQQRLANSQSNVEQAQINYNAAVERYGANSLQAERAAHRLSESEGTLANTKRALEIQNQRFQISEILLGVHLLTTAAMMAGVYIPAVLAKVNADAAGTASSYGLAAGIRAVGAAAQSVLPELLILAVVAAAIGGYLAYQSYQQGNRGGGGTPEPWAGGAPPSNVGGVVGNPGNQVVNYNINVGGSSGGGDAYNLAQAIAYEVEQESRRRGLRRDRTSG